VPLGVTFTRATAILGHGGLCSSFCPTIDPTIPSICVAARRASSRASSHSPCLICEDRTRCDAGGPAAKSRNALLIPRWRDRDPHGPPGQGERHRCLSCPVTHAAVAHALFETIHPRVDASGLIGRILIGWILAHRTGITVAPPSACSSLGTISPLGSPARPQARRFAAWRRCWLAEAQTARCKYPKYQGQRPDWLAPWPPRCQPR